MKENKHHVYYTFQYNGKKTHIYTYLSHSTKEVSPKLRSKMAGQLKIGIEELDRLIDCKMSEEDLTVRYLDAGELE
ncbi:hypothetical protein [Methanoplanus limicola]|uniref:hypothetical protein n=1 Tax=Methanoplanus limicola TaxID=2315 RepID=UPI0012F6A190|nr:hypothetical protein [Methanoplanus limicola]